MGKGLLLLAVFFLSMGSAYATPPPPIIYKYSVKVPATVNTCADEATALGARFVQATGMILKSSACLGTLSISADSTSYPLYWLYITYTIPNSDDAFPKLEYSAVLGTPDDIIVPTTGAYASYSACVSDLAAQTSAFDQNTGLGHVAAFCEQASDPDNKSYILEVDGFGTPQSNLYSFTPPYMEGEVPPAVFAPDVAKMIAAAGGTVVKSVGGAVFYYNKAVVPVDIQYLSFQDTLAHCNAQTQMTQNMFAQIAGTSEVQCIASADVGSYLAVLQSGGATIQEFPLPSAPDYPTFDACMADRNVQVQGYQAMGNSILGALCEISDQADGTYTMHFFQQQL